MSHSISICSRHDLESENKELLAFCKLAEEEGISEMVESLFYDSNSNCCTLTLAPEIEEYSVEEERVLAVAKKTLSQFEWHGGIKHGASWG